MYIMRDANEATKWKGMKCSYFDNDHNSTYCNIEVILGATYKKGNDKILTMGGIGCAFRCDVRSKSIIVGMSRSPNRLYGYHHHNIVVWKYHSSFFKTLYAQNI